MRCRGKGASAMGWSRLHGIRPFAGCRRSSSWRWRMPAAAAYITARAAVIMDAGTGEVVWERNSTDPLPPASTTKVMTAILALESGRLDESFRVSEYAAETPPSGIHLRAGQRMRLKNLLYAVLLNSANDAAEVVAEGLAGSEEVFAARMTARARELGASTAHFANPPGCTAPGTGLTAATPATSSPPGPDVRPSAEFRRPGTV